MNKKLILLITLIGLISAFAVYAAIIPSDSYDFIDVYSITNVVQVEGSLATFQSIVATQDINFTNSSQTIDVVSATCLNITSGTGWISIGC